MLAMGSPAGGIPYPSMPYVQPLIRFALVRRLSESPSSPVSIPVPPPDGKQLDPTDLSCYWAVFYSSVVVNPWNFLSRSGVTLARWAVAQQAPPLDCPLDLGEGVIGMVLMVDLGATRPFPRPLAPVAGGSSSGRSADTHRQTDPGF